ncbi:hypothetical protein FDENT_5926 [Fusarium denticulatum]|uniref:F-box domain-containing protein n=1 Tax=Fusarium denticulatum TaxID=48507 RepID=A0A8H5X9I7_9HYPO|nr:hypothetical protein FDENT_5926 [Fusarium denticulatum]
MSVTRNTNQSSLFRLPPEVLLLMTEDDSLEWEDLRRLRHVCFFFFNHLSKRVLKDRDFFFFRNACMHADVDILIECLKKDAIPTGAAWESPHRSAGDYVVAGFRAGNFSVEQFKHTWQWLSDHGYELSYSTENTVDAPEQYRPFSADLLYMLFLKQLDGQALNLKSLVNSQIYKDETTELYTFMWDMYRYIFDSLPPWSSEDDEDKANVLLRLEDPNGIADNFGDKVKALIEYNSVDEGEARVLKDIWGSLEKMARKRIERGSLDFDQDGLWFWYELNISIAYVATDRTVLEGRARGSQDGPIHVFEMQYEAWYPAEKLCWIRMKFAEDRGPIDRSKFEDRSIGEWWNMPLCDWDFFVPEWKEDSKGWLEHIAAEADWLEARGVAVQRW